MAELLRRDGPARAFALSIEGAREPGPGWLAAWAALLEAARLPGRHPELIDFVEALFEQASWLFRGADSSVVVSLMQDAVEAVMRAQSGVRAERLFRDWLRNPALHSVMRFHLFRALAGGRLPNSFELLLEYRPKRSDADFSGWYYAVEASHDPRALPILEAHLADPLVGGGTRRAIVEFPHKAAIPYIERLLAEARGKDRNDLLMNLGRLGVRGAALELVSRLRHRDRLVAKNAAAMLGTLFKAAFGSLQTIDPPDVREKIIRKWEQWASDGFAPDKLPRDYPF